MSASTIPARPRSSCSQLDETEDALELRISRRQWAGAFFMILWLTGWTVGCVALAWMVIQKPEFMTLVFAIPFWASWFFVASLLVWMLCRAEHLALLATGFAYEQRVIRVISRRFVPMSEIREFAECVCSVDSESGHQSKAIELVGIGRSLTFGENLPNLERIWLIWRFNQMLTELRTRPETAPAPAPFDASREDELLTDAPPRDSKWELEDEGGSVTFRERGDWSPRNVGGLVFINLFWNGIVGVFVGKLLGLDGDPIKAGAEWWGMMLFLIPFEVIGLVMVLGLIWQLLEPWRITRWRFDANGVIRLTTRLGIGRERLYSLESYGGCEVRDDLANHSVWNVKQANGTNFAGERGVNFGLLVVDRQRREICSIANLTLGEARWMKSQVETLRREWFA